LVNEQSTKTRQAGLFNVPALTTNIFAAATSNTNIHNKTLLISLVNEVSIGKAYCAMYSVKYLNTLLYKWIQELSS